MKYKHTGKLIPSTTKPHVAEPYARIGENRCAVCGDIIEEITNDTKEVQMVHSTNYQMTKREYERYIREIRSALRAGLMTDEQAAKLIEAIKETSANDNPV
jgi:hypothetical protein